MTGEPRDWRGWLIANSTASVVQGRLHHDDLSSYFAARCRVQSRQRLASALWKALFGDRREGSRRQRSDVFHPHQLPARGRRLNRKDRRT